MYNEIHVGNVRNMYVGNIHVQYILVNHNSVQLSTLISLNLTILFSNLIRLSKSVVAVRRFPLDLVLRS